MDRFLNMTNESGTPTLAGNGGNSTFGSRQSDQALDQIASQSMDRKADASRHVAQAVPDSMFWIIVILAIVLVLVVLFLLLSQLAKSSIKPSIVLPEKKRLSDSDREKLLSDVRQWIAGKAPLMTMPGESK